MLSDIMYPSNWELQTAAGKHILIISLNNCFYTETIAFIHRDSSPSLLHVNKPHYKAQMTSISNIDEQFGLGELPCKMQQNTRPYLCWIRNDVNSSYVNKEVNND